MSITVKVKDVHTIGIVHYYENLVPYSKNVFSLLYFILLSAASSPVLSQSSSITLQDALQATIEKQKSTHSELLEQVSNGGLVAWIDGVPTFSIQYFHNQNSFGSKETELSLVLPIKSNSKLTAEAKLKRASDLIKVSAKEQLALYYSGLIRDLIWLHKKQSTQSHLLAQKQEILTSLFVQIETLTKRNALPEYILFLIKKELNDYEILQFEYSKKLEQTQEQYEQLTGLSYLPDQVSEKPIEDPVYLLNQHPKLKMLDATWESQLHLLNIQSNSSEPWSLSVNARQIDSPDLSENQIGIGVDIPISTGSQYTVVQQNEYVQSKVNFDVTKYQLMNELATNVRADLAHYQFLVERQRLLENNLPNILSLEQAIKSVLDSNTTHPDNRATLIRFIIELVDAKAEVSLNKLTVQHQISIIRQSTGLSL